jgi:hypothetical protein
MTWSELTLKERSKLYRQARAMSPDLTYFDIRDAFDMQIPKDQNVQTYSTGGVVEEPVAATFGLPEVNIYPQNEFGDIARSQGVNTARNWRTVKEGTTKGINDFYNDPRTQLVMAGLPLPSMVDGAIDAIRAIKPAVKSLKKPIKATYTSPEFSDDVKELFRRLTLPKTKNKEVLDVVDDFYNRVATPEGLKRAEALNLDKSKLLNKVGVFDDSYSYGYHRGDNIYMHPEISGNIARNTTRHELEHQVQRLSGRRTTSIDDDLKRLELLRPSSNIDYDELAKKSTQFKEPVDIDYLKYSFNNRKQDATDYFLTGSDGAESGPMLAEVQQYMLDNKFINHAYDNITPEKVKEAFMKGYYDKETPVRIFKIMKSTDNNYKLISDNLNKMLSLLPLSAGLNEVVTGKK